MPTGFLVLASHFMFYNYFTTLFEVGEAMSGHIEAVHCHKRRLSSLELSPFLKYRNVHIP